jgi:hypothetical protein
MTCFLTQLCPFCPPCHPPVLRFLPILRHILHALIYFLRVLHVLHFFTSTLSSHPPGPTFPSCPHVTLQVSSVSSSYAICEAQICLLHGVLLYLILEAPLLGPVLFSVPVYLSSSRFFPISSPNYCTMSYSLSFSFSSLVFPTEVLHYVSITLL